MIICRRERDVSEVELKKWQNMEPHWRRRVSCRPGWRDEPGKEGAPQKRVLKEVEMSVRAAVFAGMHVRKPSLCVEALDPGCPPQAHLSLSSFLSIPAGSRSSLPPVHLCTCCLLRRVIVLLTSHLVNVCTSCKFQLSRHEYRKAWPVPRTCSQLPGHPSVTACIPVVTSDSLHVGCLQNSMCYIFKDHFLFDLPLAQCLASCRCRFFKYMNT